MKKYLLSLSIFLIFASTVFSFELPHLSFGGGFEFFGNWTTASTEFEQSADVIFVKTNETIQDLNYGGFLFLDASYAELFVSVYGGNNVLTSSQTFVAPPIAAGSLPVEPRTFEKNQISMTIGLLVKYPFYLGKFTLAPLLGLSYQIFFTGDYGDPYTAVVIKTKASDFNTLWLHVGGNVNVDLNNSLYLKAEALYGIKSAPTLFDRKNTKFVEEIKANGVIKTGWVNTFTARLGVGYRIK
jgi:hypothetical protein